MRDVDAAAICEAVGHLPEGLISYTPQKIRFVCSCGYESTNRRTASLAVQAGIHHMREVAKDATRNGFELPRQRQKVG